MPTFDEILETGDYQALIDFLAKEEEPEEIAGYGNLFHKVSCTIRHGYVNCLEALLSYDKERDEPKFNKYDGAALLTLASSTGNLSCVKTMLDFVQEKEGDELLVLHGFLQASLSKHADCEQEFLVRFPLLGVYENDVHTKRLLKIHGDFSNKTCFQESTDIQNLLDLAARSADAECLQGLLEKSRGINGHLEAAMNHAFKLAVCHRSSDLGAGTVSSLMPFKKPWSTDISEEKVSRVLEIARSHAPEEILELCSNFLEERVVTLDTDHLFGLATPFVGGIFADNCRHEYQDDHTLLVYHLLCRMNRMDCLKKLLKAGVNPDIIDTNSFRGNDLAEMKELLLSSLEEDEGPAEETDRRDGGAAEEIGEQDDEPEMHQEAKRQKLEEDFQAMNIGTSVEENPQLMGDDQPPMDESE